MARKLRVEFAGAIYHVSARMLGEAAHATVSATALWPPEKSLFRDDMDRHRFLDQLDERVRQYNIRLYLFVCMTNHFHLVFETPEANCSRFMQSLSTAYTVYYNCRHKRHGHLLDGRYKAKLVEGDDYLLSLSRYVHLNPVQIGAMKVKPIEERIKALRAYPWSSYPSYIGRRKALEFVEYGPVLAEMGTLERERRKRYREFVESGLAESDAEFKAALKVSALSIGSEGFRSGVDKFYEQMRENHGCVEDVSFRRVTEPLPVDDVLRVTATILGVDEDAFMRRCRNSQLRAIGASMLIRFSGLTQRQVAKRFGLGTGGAVSAQVRRLPGLLVEDRKLRRLTAKIETTLESKKDELCAAGKRLGKAVAASVS